MVSTKQISKTIPEIETALKNFGGDMVKIEYLENCLRALPQNDVARFCHLKLAELYAYKLMFSPAAKQMEAAADKATNYKDKINFYLKEIEYLIKISDFLLIDKAFKKAMLCAAPQEKEQIKSNLKLKLMAHAQELEKKGRTSNAASIYERLLDMHSLINETERKQILAKISQINSRLGRIVEAKRYEQMMTRPAPQVKDQETQVKKISWEELGIE